MQGERLRNKKFKSYLGLNLVQSGILKLFENLDNLEFIQQI